MSMLETIRGPRDLDDLTERELVALAREIRDVLIETVSRTGGHLGPNLGMVEITLALHRVFDSPHDRILFDVGHQAYVHKLLTGRYERFSELRQEGGLSGYPSRAESEHDLIENSHASAALSYADGLAKAYELRGEKRQIVTVIGDGALTGGMAWEALNNIAAAKNRPMVIVVNDNGRSYTRTVGGFAEHLNALRTNPKYERVLELVRASLTKTPLVGNPLFEVLHGLKRGLKDILAPQGLFEDLGMKYVGPVDGHDRAAVEHALEAAKRFGGPVIVHCVTKKGHGYEVAERDEQDHLHQIRSDQTGTWTKAFSEELVALGADRPDVVAITAAMKDPTGLGPFAAAYPERFFDVGIAEQHAVTSAAGLAMGGMHPVVAIYATFMNRAFDQLLMDVALHQCGVTFVLDRSGITGEDGASHNGMWDLSIFQVVPGLRIAAPRDGSQLRSLLREAVEVSDAPTMLRFSKGKAEADIPSIDRVGGCDVLARSGESDVLLVAVGSMVPTCLEVATRLEGHGIGATVVDPRWIKPVDAELVELARKYRLVVSVEDNGRTGGAGAALGVAMCDEGVDTPLHVVGIPQEFLSHAKRPALMARLGLGAQDLARDIVERIALLDDELLDPSPELETAPLQTDPHP